MKAGWKDASLTLQDLCMSSLHNRVIKISWALLEVPNNSRSFLDSFFELISLTDFD